MNPIKLIIIGLFVLTGILSALLYQQKSKRINTQIEKRSLGWNPVSIKKIILKQSGKDSIVLSKKDGLWKTNKQYDGMGIAPQIINYLSTMQIKAFEMTARTSTQNTILLQTFDKNGNSINSISILEETKNGQCIAMIDGQLPMVEVTNSHNSISLRKLIEQLLGNSQ